MLLAFQVPSGCLQNQNFQVSVVLVRARASEASDKVPLGHDGEGGLELLLAQRAAGKYHSAGLWANSCCSHPRADEELMDAARRRVREELGCEVAGLREVAAFVYRAPFAGGICEHEYDHVLIGHASGEISPDPSEASAVQWVGANQLAVELTEAPERFAAWAPMVLSQALAALRDGE